MNAEFGGWSLNEWLTHIHKLTHLKSAPKKTCRQSLNLKIPVLAAWTVFMYFAYLHVLDLCVSNRRTNTVLFLLIIKTHFPFLFTSSHASTILPPPHLHFCFFYNLSFLFPISLGFFKH